MTRFRYHAWVAVDLRRQPWFGCSRCSRWWEGALFRAKRARPDRSGTPRGCATARWREEGLALTRLEPGLTMSGSVHLTVHCTVHGAAEHSAELLVSSTPFFAVTGADGRFRFSGVPAGRVVVEAAHPELGAAKAPAQVGAGAVAQLRLPMASPAIH